MWWIDVIQLILVLLMGAWLWHRHDRRVSALMKAESDRLERQVSHMRMSEDLARLAPRIRGLRQDYCRDLHLRPPGRIGRKKALLAVAGRGVRRKAFWRLGARSEGCTPSADESTDPVPGNDS